MTLWLWILIGFCAAGTLLFALGSILALVQGLRLGKRLSLLSESPVVAKLESLQLQAERLARTAAEGAALQKRAAAAMSGLRESFAMSGTQAARDAALSARDALRDLVEDLR